MNKTRLFLLSGISMAAFSSAAYATLQEAEDAIREKDYVFAVQELNRLIKVEDNEEARYHLARLYESGAGVEKDENVALLLYKQAAEAGVEKAALKLGNAYYLGKGTVRNFADAFKWYKQAAEKGNYAAQYNIGLMYAEGTGIKKDAVKAFEFYKKAGEQGYGPAQYALGTMFLKGTGTPQDFTAAIRWYKLAADQGDSTAQMDLAKLYGNTSLRGLPFNLIGAHMYYNIVSAYAPSPLKEEAAALREEVTAKMQPAEVQEAQMRAQRWRKKSDAENIKLTVRTDKETMLVAAGISRRELNGAVRSNNFKPVLDKLLPKAEKGDFVAQLALGDLYTLGQGMEANSAEAFKWYSKAAETKSPIAFFKLGPMYCEGEAVEPDLSKCYMYFLLAKKYADEDSMPAVEETIKMLDENFNQQIRDAGVKMAEEYDKEAVQPQKGLLESFKEKLFKKDDDVENEVVKQQPEPKEASDADDFFADM